MMHTKATPDRGRYKGRKPLCHIVVVLLCFIFIGHMYGADTEISQVIPQEVESLINTDTLTLADYRSLSIAVTQPQQLWDVPSVFIVRHDDLLFSIDTIDLFADATTLLEGANDTARCAENRQVLIDSVCNFVFSPESVTFSAQSKRGALDYIDFSCYWIQNEYILQHQWLKDDILHIVIGSDTLRILHTGDNTTTTLAHGKAQKNRFSVRYVNNQVCIKCPLRKEISAVDIFDALGRTVDRRGLPNTADQFFLPIQLSAGIYYVSVRFTDGAVAVQPVKISN